MAREPDRTVTTLYFVTWGPPDDTGKAFSYDRESAAAALEACRRAGMTGLGLCSIRIVGHVDGVIIEPCANGAAAATPLIPDP